MGYFLVGFLVVWCYLLSIFYADSNDDGIKQELHAIQTQVAAIQPTPTVTP